MDTFLRWLAARRGVEVDPNSELRLELSSFPDGGSGLFVILALIAALALVVFAYRRDAHRLAPNRRLILATLRGFAVLAVFFVLLEPNLVAVQRDIRPGSTIVLVDTSQSMTHRDSYRQKPEIAQSWRRIGVQSPQTSERSQLVSALLSRESQALLVGMAKQNDVHVYGFDAGIEPLATLPFRGDDARSATSSDEAAALPDLSNVPATGKFTNPGFAVRAALERHRESQIAGLVILSDGRRNLGAQGSEIARLIEQRRVAKTLVMPIGDPSATQALRLTRIDAPERVFQKDPFAIRANIEAQGYEDVEVKVTLSRELADGDGTAQPVATRDVRLGFDRPESLVEFGDLRSVEDGVFVYSVAIEPPEFEAPSAERHVQRAQVEVLGEQTRVLVVAGGPSHEFRFLRTQLIRDNTVDVSTWLLSADADFPQDGNTVIERLPSERDALDEFDVFVFIDPDASKLDPAFCELVAKQVEENGAGLWWVCGEIYTLDASRSSASTRALVDILPVVPDVDEADHRFGLGRARTRELRYELTAAGRLHKLARIHDDRETAEQLWATLPGFYVGFPVERTKPAAIVIAEYTDPSVQEFGKIPLIATQFYGAGRVTFTGTDDTYRWRSIDEEAHNRFWIEGLRHLFEGRLTAGNARLRLGVDEAKVELGSPQRVFAEVKTETFDSWVGDSFEVTLTSDGPENRLDTIRLLPVEGSPGGYEARVWPTAVGFYRLRPVEDLGRSVQTSFQVVPAQIEREGPADLRQLQAIAKSAGGVLCSTPEELAAEADSIQSMTVTDTFSSSHAVWDSWITILFVLGLLTAEWWLRKRFNLL